jgi:hypothetical protein
VKGGGSQTRRHVRGRYRLTVLGHDGNSREAEVYVNGVGLGYFARYSLAVSTPLPEFHPPVYGIDGGCLFRGWLPDHQGAAQSPFDELGLAKRVAEYVSARRDRLPLEFDPTERLGEQLPVWRHAADWLALPFGRTRLVARPAIHRLSRRLLRTSHPTVIDPNMALSRWCVCGGTAMKVDYDERGLEVFSADPSFDIAMAAADYYAETGSERGFPRGAEGILRAPHRREERRPAVAASADGALAQLPPAAAVALDLRRPPRLGA